MNKPVCWIIAGPNGAGKTTFALKHLPTVNCQNFVNADLIASGLSPLEPGRELVSASRLFLNERSAVSETLDRKRRLEQYAVVWKDNRSVIIDNNDKKISHRINE